METANNQIARVRNRAVLKIADVEYRVLWNEGNQGWDVLRNGAMTDISGRRKRKSAVDSAIRDAKAELEPSGATIVITCLTGRQLETLWRGSGSLR